MLQSRTERQALFEPVSEISRRLQPRNLVDASTRYAKQKVAKALGGVSDAVKDNGGAAAAVALGAFVIFDAGRRSARAPQASVTTLSTSLAAPRIRTQRQCVTKPIRARRLQT